MVLVYSVIAGFAFAAGALRAGALDRAGAVGGGLFAASLVGLGGWGWGLPGLAFFVGSSALSGLPGGSGDAPSRTLRQVVANGGVAWACLLAASAVPAGATAHAALYAGFVGALSAAAADTWATEIGTRYGGAPVSVVSLEPVPAGTSGGVTVAGTLAAVGGAASVGGTALAAAFAGLAPTGGPWGGLAFTAAGVAGMSADSLAGATVQARYPAGDGATTERPPQPGIAPVRGWRAVDNDAVNAIGTATGAAVAVALALGA
jgi:uncharacterized membrane protein